MEEKLKIHKLISATRINAFNLSMTTAALDGWEPTGQVMIMDNGPTGHLNPDPYLYSVMMFKMMTREEVGQLRF